MPVWSATDLAVSVLTTLQEVLVHQRARWASLFGHQHQYEGWWKAEFFLAVESGCWRMDLPEATWVNSEVKPRDHGVGDGKQSIDLLVARWCEQTDCVHAEPPRLWIEIKERGTWWGDPRKALCQESGSVACDIEKWRQAPWKPADVVVACQIVAHDAEENNYEPLPQNWRTVLDEIHAGAPRFLPTRSVQYRSFSPTSGALINRFATIDFFTIYGAEHIPAPRGVSRV